MLRKSEENTSLSQEVVPSAGMVPFLSEPPSPVVPKHLASRPSGPHPQYLIGRVFFCLASLGGRCSGKLFWYSFMHLYFFGCAGSLLLPGFLTLLWGGLLSSRAALPSHRAGCSCCQAWTGGCLGLSRSALGLSSCGSRTREHRLQELWWTGLVAPRHVGSSRNRDRSCVPCIGRQIPYHQATREALRQTFDSVPPKVCLSNHLSWLDLLKPLDE